MKDEYHKNSHCKYDIKLHVILVVKYRKPLLIDAIAIDMKNIFLEIAQRKGFIIDTMEADKDHIHLLIDAKPTLSAHDIVHSLKSISTYRIYRLHRVELKKHFWKANVFFSDGYFVCSTGKASLQTIQNYINEQD